MFIADALTMENADHPLLAVTAGTREELGGEYDAEVAFGRTFRVAPDAVPPIEANCFLGRRDFPDYSKTASGQPDGVFRGFAGEMDT